MYVISCREVEYTTAPEKTKEQLINNQVLLFCPYDDWAVMQWVNAKLYPWLDEHVLEGHYSIRFKVNSDDEIFRKFDRQDITTGCTIIVSFTTPVAAERFKQQCMKWKLEK
jgi:hypothetical protein